MAERRVISPDLLRQLLRYDPETGKLFWREREPRHFNATQNRLPERTCKTWNTRYAGREALCQPHSLGYLHGFILGRNMKAHRAIYAMQTGEWPFEIDHDNGVRSDNRWKNLKPMASRSDQLKNMALRSDNTSGVPGVSRDRTSWAVKIGRTRIGNFTDFNDAVAARRAAEIEHGYHPNHGRR